MPLEDMTVLDGLGAPTTIKKITDGRKAAANAQSVAIDEESKTALDLQNTNLGNILTQLGAANTKLDAVAASLLTIDGRVDGVEALLAAANGALYAEDGVHASGALGRLAIGVRKDTASSLAGTDGDYTAPIFDAQGRQHVNVGALPALAAGTNNIGDVDVATLPIAFGAGAVGATVPRFTLASDDPAVVALTSTDPVSVTADAPQTLSATIANSASLSDSVQVDGKLVGIYMPASWTSAGLTFQASQDGSTWFNVYDEDIERTVASAAAAASRYIAFSLNEWLGIKFVKVRSGTAGSPTNQGAERVIKLIIAG